MSYQFGLTFRNEIKDVMLPKTVQRRQSGSNQHGGGRFKPRPRNTGGFDVSRELQTESVEDRKSGSIDNMKAMLPLPCEVEFTSNKRSTLDGEIWEQGAECTLPYDPDTYRNVIVEGSWVKFADQLPSREDYWYEIMALEVTRGLFATSGSTIKLILRERQLDTTGNA